MRDPLMLVLLLVSALLFVDGSASIAGLTPPTKSAWVEVAQWPVSMALGYLTRREWM